MIYALRFWNKAGECIKVGGKYMHEFDSFEDAWNAAEAMLKRAYKIGAVEIDINNLFWSIEV